MSSPRPFDVVLFGATGFTGGLIADYLVGRVGETLKIGLAGRDRAKLEALRQRLRDTWGAAAAELGILEADSGDPASLRAMARATRVIITTVGPYARYGEPLVAACIDEGTDYVDLTGETGWWREIVERYHERAAARDVLIIPSCGYDCIPADMGALHCATALAASGAGDQPMSIDAYARGMGSASGGTVASALEMLGAGTMVEPDEPDKPPLLHYAPDVDRWVVRSIVLDPWVVQRSAQLRPDDFGGELRFHQYFAFPSRVAAAAAVGFGAAALTVAKLGPVRALLRKLRPSGSGPSADQRANGWFRADFVGRAGGREVRTHVSGGDPGYGETSKMISEAAIMLAQARDSLPMRGGVVTTAAGLGVGFIDRLQAAGLDFVVD
jgi:saccharopine dehydrogenase (NAD+, L-glutamate forming)